jgi:phage-related minor tail protein
MIKISEVREEMKGRITSRALWDEIEKIGVAKTAFLNPLKAMSAVSSAKKLISKAPSKSLIGAMRDVSPKAHEAFGEHLKAIQAKGSERYQDVIGAAKKSYPLETRRTALSGLKGLRSASEKERPGRILRAIGLSQ